jgi:hypothetical protein
MKTSEDRGQKDRGQSCNFRRNSYGRHGSQYRLRFKAPADEEFIAALRLGTNGGWPVGGDRFKRELAWALKCRVTPLPPGPKPKTPPDKRQLKPL